MISCVHGAAAAAACGVPRLALSLSGTEHNSLEYTALAKTFAVKSHRRASQGPGNHLHRAAGRTCLDRGQRFG
jgi:hypothetical protein